MVVAGGAGPADEETTGDAAAYGEQGPGVAREGGGTVPAAGEGGPSGGGLRKGRHQRLPLQLTNPKVQHPNHSILDNLLRCSSLSSPTQPALCAGYPPPQRHTSSKAHQPTA